MNRLHAILAALIIVSVSTAARAQTLDDVIKSNTDLWGEAALREPGEMPPG